MGRIDWYVISISISNFLISLMKKKIATFGGIFGLCLGGSIVSLFEMLYCFTFRLVYRIYYFWKINRNAKRPWHPSETDIQMWHHQTESKSRKLNVKLL